MNKTTTIAVAIVVAAVVIAGGIVGFGTITSGKSSGSNNTNYLSKTSFSVADFGIDHPDAGAYGWMAGTSHTNTSNTLQKYDPNIKVVDLKGGSGAVASAIAAGTVQMGMLSADGALHAINSSVPIKIVGVYRTSPIGDFVYVSPSSTYNKLSDLSGKNVTFANSKPGSLDVLLNGIIAADYKVNITHDYVGSHEAQQAAVLNGKATASTGAYFDVYKLVKSGYLKSIGNITENWPAFVVVANTSFIHNHPNAVKAALMGMEYGNYLFDQNAGNFAYNFLKSYYNFSASETQFFMSTMHYSTNGTIYLKSLNEELTTLQADNIISPNLKLSQLYTDQFSQVVNTTYPPGIIRAA
ncbi:hypothetical protein IX51_08895 [uncultured archaeon]|nr:hypothetical protein IX51_08895 [uncultured archaeon]